MARKIAFILLIFVLVSAIVSGEIISIIEPLQQSALSKRVSVDFSPLPRTFSCLMPRIQFLASLEMVIDHFLLLADKKEASCSAGNCATTKNVIWALATLQSLTPKLEQCPKNEEICQQISTLNMLMRTELGTYFSFLVWKNGHDLAQIKMTLAENALFQYSEMISAVIATAKGKLC
ncbi:hypothetical protein HY495_01300 [Candidatus Woesearchaeota archaeon]|nr:hypothetical protein [Candidatus Woesearchaeota archaeon]